MRGTVVTMSIVAGLAVPALAAPAQAATTFPRKAVQQTINGAASYRVRVKLGSAKTYAFDWRQSA